MGIVPEQFGRFCLAEEWRNPDLTLNEASGESLVSVVGHQMAREATRWQVGVARLPLANKSGQYYVTYVHNMLCTP